MPLYDYDCAACGRRIEVVHGVHAPGPAHCPNCGGGPLKKAFAPPAIHFKGSGWAKKERRATSKSSAAGGGEGAGETKEPAKTGAGEGSSSAKADEGASKKSASAATTSD
jgi:putative FmdB family regulatory protein